MQIQVDYNKAINRKYPEQIVVVIVNAGNGKYNPIPIGWTSITSNEPPMMTCTMAPERYSLELIRKRKEFVISFPSSTMAGAVRFFGTFSGRDVDKISEFGAKTLPAHRIDCVLFSDAVANFECVLETEVRTGDHILIVGKIILSHMNEDESINRLYSLDSDQKIGGITDF